MKIQSINSFRKIFITTITCIFFLVSGIMAHAQNKTSTLIGYIVVPDIIHAFDKMDKIASTIDPEKFKTGILKAQAGLILGDPDFENIDRTKSTVIMFFYNPLNKNDPQKSLNDIEFAVLLPTKDRTRYKKIFDIMNLPNEANGQIVILSNKKSSLLSAQREMKLYRKISSNVTRSDISLLVKIDTIMSVYNAEITNFLNSIQTVNLNNYGLPGQNEQLASFLSMGKIFIYALIDLAAQSKDYQLDISFNETSITFSSEHSTIQGSTLSRFFESSQHGTGKCLNLIPARCQLTYAGYFDMKRTKDFFDNILAEALKHNPSLEKDINRDLIDAYKKYTELYLGDFAVTYGFDDANLLQMHLAASTDKNNDEYLAINDKFMATYNEVIKKLNGDASAITGYTIQRNFRKISGFDVHRYLIKMDDSKLKDEEKEVIQKMLGKEFSIEYAVANGYIVASTTPAVLDKIIANTVSGGESAELLSMKAFGKEMDSYSDFDIISFFEKISEQNFYKKAGETDPGMDKIQTMLKKISSEDRTILLSSKYSNGSSFSKYQVSMKMITDLFKYINDQKKETLLPEETVENPMK